MNDRPDNVPASAERHDLFKHMTTRRLPSRLLPGAEQLVPVFSCPGCDTEQPTPHSPARCPRCGLMLCCGVVGLFVWRTATEAA
jgi:hypothetical protein